MTEIQESIYVIGIVGKRRSGKSTLARKIESPNHLLVKIFDEVSEIPENLIYSARHHGLLVIWTRQCYNSGRRFVLEKTDLIYADVNLPKREMEKIREHFPFYLGSEYGHKTTFSIFGRNNCCNSAN